MQSQIYFFLQIAVLYARQEKLIFAIAIKHAHMRRQHLMNKNSDQYNDENIIEDDFLISLIYV